MQLHAGDRLGPSCIDALLWPGGMVERISKRRFAVAKSTWSSRVNAASGCVPPLRLETPVSGMWSRPDFVDIVDRNVLGSESKMLGNKAF